MGRGVSSLNVNITTTKVFDRLKKAAKFKVVISRGGARSSKSHSLTQFFIERLMNDEPRRILVLRKTQPSLKLSVIPMFYSLLSEYGIYNLVTIEKQNMNIKYKDSLIHFGGLDDVEKLKSSEWNDIWMEEATEFTFDDYKQLKLRTSAPFTKERNQIHLSFNPIDEHHWIKQELIDKRTESSLIELISTYKDNPFLTRDYVKTLEALERQDPSYFRVYGLGEWGKLENLIYKNWEVIEKRDAERFKNAEQVVYGLDFGFVNPSALVRIAVDGQDAYVQEKIYQSGLTTANLVEKMKRVIPEDERKNCMIFADAAEPDRIEEINQGGFWCVPAKKDVLVGIDTVKRYHLYIDEDSLNVKKELQGYSYRKDNNGVVREEPIKFNDHLCDALRYALHTLSEGRPRIRVI